MKGRVDEWLGTVKEASKCLTGMKIVISTRALGMSTKRRLYEKVVVPAVLYGAEMWNLRDR